MIATFDITECALQVTDLADAVAGTADVASVADIDLSALGADNAGIEASDPQFGSSSRPVCWWCKGTGESTWLSSGTVVSCPHCGGSGQ
jgi:hypothetical protein